MVDPRCLLNVVVEWFYPYLQSNHIKATNQVCLLVFIAIISSLLSAKHCYTSYATKWFLPQVVLYLNTIKEKKAHCASKTPKCIKVRYRISSKSWHSNDKAKC